MRGNDLQRPGLIPAEGYWPATARKCDRHQTALSVLLEPCAHSSVVCWLACPSTPLCKLIDGGPFYRARPKGGCGFPAAKLLNCTQGAVPVLHITTKPT